MFKYKSRDRFDAHIPDKPHFIQDDYRVSSEDERFHISSGFAYKLRGRGFSFGIDKRISKVSGSGVMIDSYYIGKSENR